MADEATVQATKEELYAPQSFSVDDILEGGGDSIELEAETKEEKEPEIEIEGGDTKVVTESPTEVAELKKQIQEMQSELLNVGKKQNVKVELDAPKTEKLSRAQLVGILREHKDDPEVLFNVAEYIAEQKALETRDATMKDVNYRTWSSNLSGMANRILSEDEDGYLAANPKVQRELAEYANNLGMGDHPIGKLAAYAIMRLSDSVKAKGAAKLDEKSEKAEKVDPNKGKMDKTRLTAQRDKNQGLTVDQLAVAKKFGVKPETYAKFVRRS